MIGATISGTVQSKSRKGNSIKVDDVWYSTYSPKDLDHVSWKDDVVFNYVTKGDYKNIKGDVRVASSTATSSGSKRNNNLGVELGHASNLAMTVAMASDFAPSSVDFYKHWLEQTETIYAIMNGLRAKYESEGAPPAETWASAPTVKLETTDVTPKKFADIDVL